MKITKSELKELIKESVSKFQKKEILENRVKEINAKIKFLNEDEVAMQDVEVSTEEKGNIFDTKLGEILILNFEGRTLKLKRVWDALFLVTDGFESTHLNTGDYVEMQGNPDLNAGREYTFKVYKPTRDVETSALQSWKVVKN
jgi:hypothetical protein